jgi:hypothetical protein
MRFVGWDGLTAIATVALALIGGFAAAYAKGQLQDFRKESRIKHLIELVDQFERDPLASHRRKLGEQRIGNGKLKVLDLNDPPYELHDILNFFEHMGYLLEGDYIDLHGVSIEFHYWIFHVWADAKPLVSYERAETPVYYKHLERMVERLVEVDKQRFGKFEFPSQEDLTDFYMEEARSRAGIPIPRQKRRKRMSFSPSVDSTERKE